MAETRTKAALGGKKSSKSKSKSKAHKGAHKMHISKSEGDSHYLVQHESEPGPDGMPGEMSKPHVVGGDEMADHIAQNMPLAGGGAPGAAPGGAPAPAPVGQQAPAPAPGA